MSSNTRKFAWGNLTMHVGSGAIDSNLARYLSSDAGKAVLQSAKDMPISEQERESSAPDSNDSARPRVAD